MDPWVGIYGFLFVAGAFANGAAFCCGPAARARSPLLLGLILADLLVCCLSGPLTVALYLPASSSWNPAWTQAALFLQAWPVSASTLSMAAVSVERFLLARGGVLPAGRRSEGARRRRRLLVATAVGFWVVGGIVVAVQLLVQPLADLLAVHLLPVVVVLGAHLALHARLTALSLTARARHGELPLPVPLLRRPTHVIIVAGISNKQGSGREKLERSDNSPSDTTDPEVTEPPSSPPISTLRGRRRLANSLLGIAAVFTSCWLPHIVCRLCIELSAPERPSWPSSSVQRYSLLIGHVHSAIGPILYWAAVNRPSTPAPTSEGCCRCLPSFSECRRRLRFPTLQRVSVSSTNEAALGPFNPRLVRPPPPRRRSSQCLY